MSAAAIPIALSLRAISNTNICDNSPPRKILYAFLRFFPIPLVFPVSFLYFCNRKVTCCHLCVICRTLKTFAMDSTTVERLERARIRFLLWKLVTFALGVGGLILYLLPVDETMREAGMALFSLFSIFFWFLFHNELRVFRKADRDKTMDDALNNEMYESYHLKSMAFGFVAVLAFALLSLPLGKHVNISIQAYSVIVCYVGGLAAGIRLFFYYKRG